MQENEKQFKRRGIICIVLAVIILFAFTARLFDWQIIHGREYRDMALKSTGYTLTSQAVRGEIYDRNGVPLAVNRPTHDVVLDKLYLDKANENQIILRLIKILEDCGEKWTDVLPIVVDENGEFAFDKSRDAQTIASMKKDVLEISEFSSVRDCVALMTKSFELSDISDVYDKRKLMSVKYNMKKSGYSSSVQYVLAENISQSAVAIISELTEDIPGVEIRTSLVRVNENPTLAPHLVGALGSLTDEEYEKLKDKGYEYDAVVGKFGVEQALEEQLKGESGTKAVQKNADGTVMGVIEQTPAKPGNTVYLTIDAQLQQVANKALADNITAAQKYGEAVYRSTGRTGNGEDCVAGAAVLLDVRDFSVLAAATYPTFDLAQYYNADYYAKISADETSPMFNRAVNGSFAPGSIFKPCVACAALEEKVITETETVRCTTYYNYFPGTSVACMGYHGSIDVRTAIEKSCNYFFSEMGRRLGIDTLYLYAEKFGLGVRTGIEIDEAVGTLAGRDSENWYVANIASAAIGQSDNAFTPLQLATYAATIATEGKRYRTHIVSKITDYSGERVVLYNDPEKPELLSDANISHETFKAVKEGMNRVSTSGTAFAMFADYRVKLGVKTGTAENSGSDHVTFIGFAPYDNPEVAIAVVLEHGATSTYSKTVAKTVLDAYFDQKEAAKKAEAN